MCSCFLVRKCRKVRDTKLSKYIKMDYIFTLHVVEQYSGVKRLLRGELVTILFHLCIVVSWCENVER